MLRGTPRGIFMTAIRNLDYWILPASARVWEKGSEFERTHHSNWQLTRREHCAQLSAPAAIHFERLSRDVGSQR